MELMCDRVAIINNGKILGVKAIKDMLSDASGMVINRFKVKPIDKALELLKPKYNDLIKAVEAEFIDMAVDGDQIPEITGLLVSNGIGIFGVSKVEKSLEEAFMNITGGGNEIA